MIPDEDFYDMIVDSDLFYSWVDKPSAETCDCVRNFYRYNYNYFIMATRTHRYGVTHMKIVVFNKDGSFHRYEGYPPSEKTEEYADLVYNLHTQGRQELITTFLAYRRL